MGKIKVNIVSAGMPIQRYVNTCYAAYREDTGEWWGLNAKPTGSFQSKNTLDWGKRAKFYDTPGYVKSTLPKLTDYTIQIVEFCERTYVETVEPRDLRPDWQKRRD